MPGSVETTPPDARMLEWVESLFQLDCRLRASPSVDAARLPANSRWALYALRRSPCNRTTEPDSLGMTRIFTTLALLTLGLFIAAAVLGLAIGDLYDQADQSAFQTAFKTRGIHMLAGTAAALAVVFVHSIVITYFVGTSRWCKEVTETYLLDPAALVHSNQLKRRTFPWCVLGMLTVVGVIALGAASDPGTGRANTASMADFHLVAAFAGLALVGWTFLRAWLNILENQAVIQQILDQVQQVRQERGLETDSKTGEKQLAATS